MANLCSLMEAIPPTRATISSIGRKIGKLPILENELDKLPLTEKLLNDLCESINDFQMRRIRYVSEQLFAEKGKVKKWELVRQAGLRKRYAEELDPFINRIVAEYEEKTVLAYRGELF